MDRPTCATCPYWLPLPGYVPAFADDGDGAGDMTEDASSARRGECRRFPPKHDKSDVCLWPLLEREMYCGEHPSFAAWLDSRRSARDDTRTEATDHE